MKKFFLLSLLAIVSISALSARPAKVTGVTIFYSSGGRDSLRPVLEVRVLGEKYAALPITDVPRKEAPKVVYPTTQTFVDIETQKIYYLATLPYGQGDVYSQSKFTPATLTAVESSPNIVIAGVPCRHMRTSVNSNTIDIWYSTAFGFSASPKPEWGSPAGVVMRVERNGRTMLNAIEVQQNTDEKPIFPASWGRKIEASDLQNTVRQSVVRTIPIFTNDRIGFTGASGVEKFSGSELYTIGGGTVIMKKVALPSDVEGWDIFAELSQYSDGDAYDRTGSIFLIPTDKKLSFLDALSTKGINSLPAFVSGNDKYPGLISTADYTTPVEMLRFFTPFGVRKFNHIKVPGQVWADSAYYKQEITHLAPMLRDSVWIAAYIGNWDAKGHIVSLRLKYYPDGRGEASQKVIPLFNTTNLLEQAGQTYPVFFDKDSLRVTFSLSDTLRNAKLVYHSTGHGGWGGGDEFNRKVNTIYLNGAKVFAYTPWRDDCATYRNLNPCSGNFANGLSSSDLSRSNWCPGSVTNPAYVELGTLTPGDHTMAVQIPLGAPEGSSFSYWCISGVLIGE